MILKGGVREAPDPLTQPSSAKAPPSSPGSAKRKKEGEVKGKALNKATVEEVLIGPPRLTRFERARIIGARALQLAMGAPPFIPVPPHIKDPISLAIAELEAKALPISIRRTLPDGTHQDIPIDRLM